MLSILIQQHTNSQTGAGNTAIPFCGRPSGRVVLLGQQLLVFPRPWVIPKCFSLTNRMLKSVTHIQPASCGHVTALFTHFSSLLEDLSPGGAETVALCLSFSSSLQDSALTVPLSYRPLRSPGFLPCDSPFSSSLLSFL